VKQKLCTSEGAIVRIRFKCGCRLELKNTQVFLILPKTPGPSKGDRRRLLGYIHDNTLMITRRGVDWFRVRSCYGLNLHMLQAASTLGFNAIWVTTPVRGGYLPTIDRLLQRKPFQYGQAGFETQIGFTPNELQIDATVPK
jgi:hypothetical protein